MGIASPSPQSTDTNNSTSLYKKQYSWIFSFFYLIEGFVQGIPQIVFPIYLVQRMGGYDIALWLQITAWANIPWTTKFLVGIANDKWGSKRFGHRFPWIFTFGILGSITWFYLAIITPMSANSELYTVFTVGWVLTGLGMAWADTALDGLILDVTPKNQIAKVQALTWTMLLIGMGGGGALLGYLFLELNLIPVLFGLTGVLLIISCILPRSIKEPPMHPLNLKTIGEQILSVLTRRKNYVIYIFTIISGSISIIIVTFYGYLILVDLNIINVESTFLSLKEGDPIDILEWNIIFYGANGVGIVVGSLINARITDKKRKLGMLLAFAIYFPICLASNWLLGIILGVIGQVIFGIAGGAFDTAHSTLRADLTRKYYPEIKSFYYAILISCWNAGTSLGNLLSAKFFVTFISLGQTFNQVYFWLSLITMGLLILCFGLFRAIDPNDYEFNEKDASQELYFG